MEFEQKYFPVTWMNLAIYDRSGMSSKPNIWGPLIIMVTVIIGLIILADITLKNKEIETYPEIY